jgi:branched-chain amino acid transport system permease protein
MESVMIVAMVVLGGMGHLPGVILGALLLSALPEVLRYVAGPLQQMTDGGWTRPSCASCSSRWP